MVLVLPGRLLVRDALLKLELDERENLKGDGRVDKWLATVDALVPPEMFNKCEQKCCLFFRINPIIRRTSIKTVFIMIT